MFIPAIIICKCSLGEATKAERLHATNAPIRKSHAEGLESRSALACYSTFPPYCKSSSPALVVPDSTGQCDIGSCKDILQSDRHSS